jgi:glycosyltransferase involved in cell wall biosynthesis
MTGASTPLWKGRAKDSGPEEGLVIQEISPVATSETLRHAAIEELLATLPADRYRQIDFEENVAALYRTFDLFAHTPIGEEQESFGLTYVEALASGIPAVFTLAGVAPEFIQHRHNAWVVPHRDSDEIHAAFLALLADPALRETLTRNGRETTEAFDLATMIHQTENLYAELCPPPRTRGGRTG